jgi:hypothetical protein
MTTAREFEYDINGVTYTIRYEYIGPADPASGIMSDQFQFDIYDDTGAFRQDIRNTMRDFSDIYIAIEDHWNDE